MPTEDTPPGPLPRCDFCRQGAVVPRVESLRFSQQTDRGRVDCWVELPVGRCDVCNAAHLGAEAEVLIEAAVLHAYIKLSPA